MKRAILISAAILVLSGCRVSLTEAFGYKGLTPPPQLTVAEQYVGMNEREHRVTLKEFLGVDPVHVEWCAAFVNSVLTEVGLPTSGDVEGNPYSKLAARSYLRWGISTDIPEPGDIMVFSRGNDGWSGHVGFYVATYNYKGQEFWVVLGGNQDNTVSYRLYKKDYWRHLDTRTLSDEDKKELLYDRNWLLDGIPLEVIIDD